MPVLGMFIKLLNEGFNSVMLGKNALWRTLANASNASTAMSIFTPFCLYVTYRENHNFGSNSLYLLIFCSLLIFT